MKLFLTCFIFPICFILQAQTLTEKQMQNARATGYAIVASRNPGADFSIYVIPWDGVNSLEDNAQQKINPSWHPQAVIKGNYFHQTFDGTDFTKYSTVILSQEKFDLYKNTGTEWWIVCSTLPSFSEKYHVDSNGNVGIGTASPDSKLTVKGHIHTQEVKVDLSGAVAPDYVFDKDYPLPSLEETEAYIQAHRHLPEIPSASEMEANGIELKAMNLKLLQKIEELTLYLITQQKKIEALEAKVAALEKPRP